MTKTMCDRCGKYVDPITCGFRIHSQKIDDPIRAVDLCEDCQNKVKSFIFDQNKPTADKQTNLEWLRNRIQTMSAEEVSKMIYATGPNTFCHGRDCSDYNDNCPACFCAWLEEEHELKEEKE